MTRAHGRLASVSIRGTMGAGAWVGFVVGTCVGAILGALVAWLAGAILDWQRDLSFTLGVTRRLLPLGDQADLLSQVHGQWYITVPVVALSVAVFATVVGALLAGILAAAYNTSPRKADVTVDLPD